MRPLIIGHRGAAGLIPENTLAGFEKAIALGADGVELDLQLTANGELLVRHDIFAEGPPAERPPSLGEVLNLVAERRPGMTVVIDLKSTPWNLERRYSGADLVDATAPVVAAHAHPERVVLASFDWDAVEHARDVLPGCRRAFHSMAAHWLDHITPAQSGVADRRDLLAYLEGWRQARGPGTEALAPLDLIQAAGGTIWSCHHRDLTAAAAAKARALGLQVWTWTVNTEADVRRVLDVGVDAITTDHPDRVIDFFASQGSAADEPA